MSRAVLISIKPEWCELISIGEKTVEVRKTKPKLETSFKVYIYCTKDKPLLKTVKNFCFVDNDYKEDENLYGLCELVNGKVIGEFVCDEIKDYYPIDIKDPINKPYGEEVEKESCLSTKQVNDYGFRTLGYGKLHGWHISDLVIYDKPRELSEFSKPCICEDEYEGGTYCDCLHCDLAGDSDDGVVACNRKLRRSPQSWCYVEDIT